MYFVSSVFSFFFKQLCTIYFLEHVDAISCPDSKEYEDCLVAPRITERRKKIAENGQDKVGKEMSKAVEAAKQRKVLEKNDRRIYQVGKLQRRRWLFVR